MNHSLSPVISVVLGSYNRLPFLRKTIHSVRSNGISVPHEIIVVDGGSTDGSLHWLSKQKDIITIIQHNHGSFRGKKINRRSWGYFMNLGFKSASGKYILMISDDCLLAPNSIMNGYHLFEEKLANHERIGALAFFWRNWPAQNYYYVGTIFGDNITVNHGMYLNSALQEVGYIEENALSFYYADGDLCLKLITNGYKIAASPDSYVEHFEHASIFSKRKNIELAKKEWAIYVNRWINTFPDANINFRGKEIKKQWEDPDKTYTHFPFIAYIKIYFISGINKLKPHIKNIMVKMNLAKYLDK